MRLLWPIVQSGSFSNSEEFKVCVNKLCDFNKPIMNESVMWRFWKNYLDMWQKFLCIIHETRNGDW